MKSVKYYDFNLLAGGTQVITAQGEYFRIQSATGAVDVTVEGSGTVPGLLTGQGIKDTPFSRLVLKDASGLANAGQILIASKEFIDNRTYGINDLSTASLATLRTPLVSTGFFNDNSNPAANTAIQVFAPASNINGALILSAFSSHEAGTAIMGGFVAKVSAPATIVDGEMVAQTVEFSNNAATRGLGCNLAIPQFIAAGKGLYFILNGAPTAGASQQSCRYRLL